MNKKGFTLIELLVVIAIIGILTTIALISFGNARDKANKAKMVSEIGQLRNAAELLMIDENGYENFCVNNGNPWSGFFYNDDTGDINQINMIVDNSVAGNLFAEILPLAGYAACQAEPGSWVFFSTYEKPYTGFDGVGGLMSGNVPFICTDSTGFNGVLTGQDEVTFVLFGLTSCK